MTTDNWEPVATLCTDPLKEHPMSRRARTRRDKRAPVPDFDDTPDTEAHQ